jgi:hypothetical protein
MIGIVSELVDSFPADRSVAFDAVVREEPFDDDEEEEEEEDDRDDDDDDDEDEDEQRDNGNSDGYSE